MNADPWTVITVSTPIPGSGDERVCYAAFNRVTRKSGRMYATKAKAVAEAKKRNAALARRAKIQASVANKKAKERAERKAQRDALRPFLKSIREAKVSALAVTADWLEEHGRTEESATLRREHAALYVMIKVDLQNGRHAIAREASIGRRIYQTCWAALYLLGAEREPLHAFVTPSTDRARRGVLRARANGHAAKMVKAHDAMARLAEALEQPESVTDS